MRQMQKSENGMTHTFEQTVSVPNHMPMAEFYPRQYFDIWYQSLAIMKDRHDANMACNEGIWFMEIDR